MIVPIDIKETKQSQRMVNQLNTMRTAHLSEAWASPDTEASEQAWRAFTKDKAEVVSLPSKAAADVGEVAVKPEAQLEEPVAKVLHFPKPS